MQCCQPCAPVCQPCGPCARPVPVPLASPFFAGRGASIFAGRLGGFNGIF